MRLAGSFFLTLVVMMAIAWSTTTVQAAGVNMPVRWMGRAACSESYTPCTCVVTTNGVEVTCTDTLLADIENVFYRTRTQDLYSVTLKAVVPPGTGSIALTPNLLADKRVQNLYMYCPATANPKVTLTIQESTFQYTRRNTTRLEIHDCDMTGQANTLFLNGFSVLATLHLVNVNGIATSFNALPAASMPALKDLSLSGCTGYDANTSPNFPDLTPARMEKLNLDRMGLDSSMVKFILTSVGASSSASSMKELSLVDNIITVVPRIGAFSQLTSLNMSNSDNDAATPGNAIPTIKTQSSVVFNTGATYVGLKNVGLATIDDGAFIGDYTRAKIDLEGNSLTEFRSGVFKSMLQQMTVQPPETAGQILLAGNNGIVCDCGISWLIRDNPVFVSSVKGGLCCSFFKFEDLGSSSFAQCV